MVSEHNDQLIDIYDMWYKPFWMETWFKIVGILALVLLVAWIFYAIYTKYIQNKPVADCSIIAYQELESLKKIHIATEQDSKNCYFKVSFIIKRYLACRYDALFMHLTDQEIVRQAALYIDPEMVLQLQKILQDMVFVKFEHQMAITAQLEQDIELIKDFIEKTTAQVQSKEK